MDGPTALAPELALLSAVRSSAWMFDDEDFDPIALVQAANPLRALGKQGAIARMHSLLEHSFRYTPNTRTFDGRDPADPATIDPVAVELLVQLMFDVRYTGDVERPVFDEDIEQRAFARFVERGRLHAWAGTYDDAQPGDPPEAQAEYPLRIARDVPFLAAHWLSGRSGCDVSPYFYLDVAERYGVLKSEPLVPPDDPTLAADELLARGPVPERNDPRGQIVRSLERSIGTVFSPRLVDRTDRERHFRRDERISDADWQRVKDDLARRGVRWDAEKQCYFETRR
ncbi:MAG: hypothetical protein HZA53_03590 [Planctomycetes bacterium]|nr:hypothetical protein [Planctomycetota bacterium]